MAKYLERFQTNTPNSPTVILDTLAKVSSVSVNAIEDKAKTSNTIPSIAIDNTLIIYEKFHERAAILEFEAGLNRQEAERLAYLELLLEFISNNVPQLKAQFESIIYNANLMKGI